jgi:ABC-2 type transport system ATP-binding protein
MRMNPPLLEIRHLKKSYGPLCAVADVSFVLQPGDCLGLLGPNGAGKTTTISMITGLITPESGEVLIEGKPLTNDTDAIKNKIGLVPQDLALFEDLSALDNLRLFGSLYHLESGRLSRAISAAIELVGLSDRVKDKVKSFSGGMKRRLNLAAALLHDPQLLLLDEPTVGVDPQSRNAIFENIAAVRARGKTVLYTTHYMEEVERLCDRVVIMDHGKVVADDSLANLRNRAGNAACLKIELANPDGAWLVELRQLAGVRSARLESGEFAVELDEMAGGAVDVLKFLSGKGGKIVHLSSDRPNLESVFLSLTGKQLRDL